MGEENVFSYSIVLVQLFNEAPQTIGDVDFRIGGSYRGRKVKYAYSDVSIDGTNRGGVFIPATTSRSRGAYVFPTDTSPNG